MTPKDKPKRPGARPPARDARSKSGPKAGSDKPAKAAAAKVAANETDGEAKAERISKVMARAGVASRRDIERMIMDGRVTLNGKLLDTPVVNVTLEDKIEVDGVPIRGIERTRLWLYHKPPGLVTTNSDPEGRPTVFDNLPEELPRVMSIGRLDINTEGLLLLTNDGGLARALELPTTGWLRRYRVRAHGEIDQKALDKLKDGIAVDGVLYGSIEATLDRTQGSNVWITMGLREGKNREIKNVLGALGLDVNRLIRVSYGPFQLGELPEGQVIEVRGRTLRDQLGPRLIEDAKANFDAPIYNAPAVAAEETEEPVQERRERPRRDEDKRERALSRLDTKRDDRRRDDRRDDRRGDDDRPKRPALGSRRNANVWMAPGARPLGEKAAAKAAKNAQTARRRGETAAPAKEPRFDRTSDRPRLQINRVHEEDGEWIRSSEAPRKRDEDEGFGRKRSFGDHPAREEGGDRPRKRSFGGEGRSERPRGDKSFGDKPRGERRPRTDGEERPRSFRDRPREDGGERSSRPARSFGGESRSDRPRGDKPSGAKPRGEHRPRTEGEEGSRPFRSREEGGERSRTGRSFGGEGRSERSRGDKPFGDKPRGAKGFSGKPKGDRPGGGGKPSGGPSRGGAKGKGMTRGADRRR
ncbi:23S rRNA pseudouridine2605 synthase [Rhizobium sp. BK529]|uniref:pseudouridine synthase n=1 Tax=unclassified Rhizobium TaxID=2613769 RepID=UPI00104C7D31|nr:MULTISPECIES: pseudouridine synthase [unclassified Rhizobium]MBB3592338.1 23S rRNA pseudouridine2605 synthase [Rhizobium sp. BK529]TCS06757.1 23S rRNA pseudouridine2605 synthase [Rhizobium sp. BK418]